MEIKQIKYFSTVVEAGSIGKAAQKLDVGASAISQQISKLEQELSIRLLQRNAFGVTPTPAGIAFLKHSQLILRQINFAVDAAHSARLSGHVSIGFPPTITALLGIPLMKLMSERYPDIRLEIVETLSGNLIQAINSRQLDLAIIFTNEIDKQWAIQPLVKEQMYLMGRREFLEKYGLHECLASGVIQAQQIGDIPLVLPRQRHSLRKLLDHSIGQLNIVYEIDGLHLLMDSLIHLELASIRPGSACLQEYKHKLQLLKVIDPEIERINYLVSLAENELSPAALAAKSAIKACIKELIQNQNWPCSEIIF
ncbi:LysR family transcriptional regulator [Acinetobacter sp. ANC 4633]|uniref:LysR family transcriptional regulator n=1 Tax=Acinetobacter sp. ANC 4633 TaxID=2529845 RepID=UPI00103D1716|nr:LysR family transcriptional regulator [Acinetobacter sp. ANC 4633]TCB25899.1 LysR family transcriptional regulator [Acinetobacter sp. ANC 4633]